MELKNKKINFLGDSITFGALASCEENNYVNLLKKNTGLAEARNYGMCGTRYAVQLGENRTPRDENTDGYSFCERFEQMDDDANIVVIFGGTNDYGHGDAPLGTFLDRSPETFYGACHYLYSGLIKKYLGKTIVIVTPLHRCNEMSEYGECEKKGAGILKQYVDIIREVAEYYALPVLDLYAKSGLQPEVEVIKNTYLPDGLHPNDLGHQVIAKKLENFLRGL